MCAQCGHATLACYKALLRSNSAHPLLKRWETLGQAKVALKVESEDDMLMLQAQAVSLGVCAQVIHDAGRTQIVSPLDLICESLAHTYITAPGKRIGHCTRNRSSPEECY